MFRKLFLFTESLEKKVFIKTIRGGLTMMIPVLLIGALALLGESFPIPAYVNFIQTFAGGLIYNFFNMIFTATFGMLSVFMTISIANSYRRETNIKMNTGIAVIFTSVICLFILSGVFKPDFSIGMLGTKGMLTALISGYVSAWLYCKFYVLLKRDKYIYSAGADTRFNSAMAVILPSFLTIVCFCIMNIILSELFVVSTFQDIIEAAINALFRHIENDFVRGLVYVSISSVLWFFGVHGSDCLETTVEAIFTPEMNQNIAAYAMGATPQNICTKEFFDVFVLMGGCGTAICLLIAIAVFGKRRSDKRLARIASLPMVFNINEIMTFGLPVIYNPILLIPFILTPVISYSVSFLAMYSGLVPLTVVQVGWTTPVILGGILSTKSIAGGILQLITIVLGVLIYAPFIKMFDRQKVMASKNNFNNLVEYFKDCEKKRSEPRILSMDNALGETAKSLSFDLDSAISHNEIKLFYQPQYDYDGKCIGVEALMRWNHPDFGMIYPPLVIELANECGLIAQLEKYIVTYALNDSERLSGVYGNGMKLSVNITGPSLLSKDFVEFIEDACASKKSVGVCLEITEQTAVDIDENIIERLNRIKSKGIQLAIDDFSMGQTSIKYLEDKLFDYIKLDGSLVSGVVDNERCINIISSIVKLSKSLGISVIAEYVETAAQRDALAKVGCLIYQGYLYSPAKSLEMLEK